MSENKGIAIEKARANVFWAGHVFQECEGINRCINCGQTLNDLCSKREKRVWSFHTNCVVPEPNCAISETWRFPEPSADDAFAVFSWHTLGRKFFVTRDQAVEFITSEAAKVREWIGPFPIAAMPTTSYNPSEFLSLRDYVNRRGSLRRADGVSTEQAWDDLIARGFDGNDRASLSTYYLRDRWDALEAGANKRSGHFIESQAKPEPYLALLYVAMDFDDELRCQAIGRVGAALLFGSVQLHRHLEGFAGTRFRHRGLDDETLARAVYWAIKDCCGYAATLRTDCAAQENPAGHSHFARLATGGAIPREPPAFLEKVNASEPATELRRSQNEKENTPGREKPEEPISMIAEDRQIQSSRYTKGDPAVLSSGDWVTPSEAEAYLAIEKRQRQHLVSSGALKSNGKGKNLTISKASLFAYLRPRNS